MAKRKKRLTGICVLCGLEGKITRDHIPPKACFPKPRPSNLITVPACEDCNAGRSDLDDKFALFLALYVHGASEEGRALWSERAKRLFENRKFKKEVDDAVEIIGDKVKISLKFGQFLPIYDAIFRGLYFKQFGEVHPPDEKFEMLLGTEMKEPDRHLADRLFKGEVGKMQFLHGINRAQEGESQAAGGLLIFYNQFFVSGVSGFAESS